MWGSRPRAGRRTSHERGGPPLLDLGRSSRTATQVVQLGPSNVSQAVHLDLRDGRGVHGERPLDSDPEAHLAHRKGFAHSTTLPPDDRPLEHLDSLAGAFNDPHVNLDRVPGSEIGDVVSKAVRGRSSRSGAWESFGSAAGETS